MISFRLAVDTDYQEFIKIERNIGETADPGSVEAILTVLDAECVVMLDDDQIIGYGVIVYGKEQATVLRIVVAYTKAFHTLKLAKELYRRMVERGMMTCVNLVEKDNAAALHLNDKMGFEVIGEINKTTPKDVYVLQLNLQENK